MKELLRIFLHTEALFVGTRYYYIKEGEWKEILYFIPRTLCFSKRIWFSVVKRTEQFEVCITKEK